jgi:hypothetical protein
MGLSYREPVYTCGYGTKDRALQKRLANRTIRRLPVTTYIADGNSYRRYYPQWDICDYKFYTRPDVVRVDGLRVLVIDAKPYRK